MSEIQSTPFGPEKDRSFMHQALIQARKAYARKEVPVGAVIVDKEGIIVAKAFNAVEGLQSQNEHAEIRALRKVTNKRGDWRLNDYWVYVTLEPCPMCIGLIKLSRCAGVVFGANSPLFGFQLDNNEVVPLYKKNSLGVIAGVCATESAELLKQFFKQKRIHCD